MRRTFAMTAGLALAIPAAVVTLLGTLAVVSMLGSGAAFPVSLVDLVIRLVSSDDPERLVRAALRAGAEALAVVCCAPVICAALIGEVAGIGGAFWYSALSAGLGAALPLAAGMRVDLADPAAVGPLLACGAVAGLVYGLVAGRRPPARAGDPAGFVSARFVSARFDLAPSRKSDSQIHEP